MLDVVSVSRLLSYSVIVLSCCMKFPQVLAIWSKRSSRGVNVRGYWMEVACYMAGVSFAYKSEFHYTTYAESILLAVQSLTIIYLAVLYSGQWTLENMLWSALSFVFVTSSVAKVVPVSVLRLLMTGTLPLIVGSKVMQMVEMFRIKSRGSVSILTWTAISYGCTARLFTIAVEVGDYQVLLNYLVACVFNWCVVLQCLYYGKEKVEENGIKKHQ